MKKDLSKDLNVYLADVGVLYIKWHNLHWNVVGMQFKSIHEYLETLYDEVSDVLDETAELLKINGEQPAASMKEYLAIATVEELSSLDVTVEKVIECLISDMTHMKKSAINIREIANKDDSFDVANLLEDHIENYNKNLWFLKSMQK